MTRADLQPGATLSIPYSLTEAGRVAIHVVADTPVDVLLVDTEGRAEYENGRLGVECWARSTNLREHRFTLELPPRLWFLLVANRAADRWVAVDHEVRLLIPGPFSAGGRGRGWTA